MGWSRFGEIVALSVLCGLGMTVLFVPVCLLMFGWPDGLGWGLAFGGLFGLLFGLMGFIGQLWQDWRDP